MAGKHKVMVVGAHADDVEIMAGGTLAKYREIGYGVVYVMSTNNMSGTNNTLLGDGTIVRAKETPLDMMKRRKSECEAAAQALGTEPVHLDHPQRHYWSADGLQKELRYGCSLPEGVEEDVPTILTAHEDPGSVERVRELILEHNPSCVITHPAATSSIEHTATALLVVNGFWQAAEKGFRGALITANEDYTFPGEMDESWDTFIDISDYLDRRTELIGKHKCQMPTAHHPGHGQRVKALRRGEACGCKAAEVFSWMRRHDPPQIKPGKDDYYGPLITELVRNTGQPNAMKNAGPIECPGKREKTP